ncbi:MAG TPA: hypothetical protein VLB46_19610 [Pyrinomonadaceae bacterium]|nr:hypothetical protein [Pyrinomonadaceae bacterium]
MERILYRCKFTGAHAKRWIRYLVPCAVICFFMVFSFTVSSEDTVFGPKTYTRTSGPIDVFQESFSIANVNSSFTVIVQNGSSAGGRLNSGTIVLNGTEIVKPSDFNPQVQEIRKTVILRESNTLRVELLSKPGCFITIRIVRDPSPVLSITSPLNGTVFRTQPITVEGTIDIASSQVKVNGVPAVVNGGHFIAQNVPLIRDGMNTITAVGTAPGGNTGQASVMVILDTMAPNIVIDSPSNGFVTPNNTISVSGMVSDVITPNPTVLVNDVPATVSNGTFLAMGVPLNIGDNQITATARDGVGNQTTASITVNRADLPGLRLQIISGQAQTALIKSSLPEPLRVKLVDAADNAIANREVLFQVSRGDGALRNSPPLPGQTGQRTLIVNTDGNGEAAVRLDLGSRSGPGNNRVQASVVGGLSPVEFSATATSGAPDRIAIVPMSNQQTGVVNQPLGMPLACVVLDASGNPVADVPVTFQITEGGGNFGGNASFVEATGADGVAHALLTLGPEPGTQNNAVAAAFQGQTDPPVTFAASGRVPGLLGNTTFSGLVLDNGDLPLRNARAVIFGTDRSAVTDATGRFLITNVPPGAQRLLIDGSGIVDSPGRIFPGLEFDLNVIGGVENSLPMPIYLPPLSTDPQSVARITGPVTTPVTLQIPGIPQATLTLMAGTIVSNHNGPASGGNPITVRLSRVNNDRVPMPPPNGSVFTLAGTVQPAGTHFSIPARVCSPNTGLPPGAQVDIFSFDHDVGQFLSIGFATVSEDGAVVCSNPGFGINKAGWFGATPPPPPTTEPKNCRVTLTANPNPVPIPQVVGPAISNEVVITATTDPGGKTVTWGGDQGVTPVISGNTLRTRYGTPGEKVVTATCEQSTQSVTVKVVRATIEINNTPAEDDDITVLNPVQTIQARVTLEGPAATVQLAVTPAGRATLDKSSLNLSSGGSDTITITPAARSQTVNDVTITATVSGAQVATEDMTIVNVVFPAIRRSNTPTGVPDRIPPRVDTPINVQVEPDLGTSGQQLTLAILNGSATNGTVTINGNATANITKTGNVNLRGGTQTAATTGLGGGNAGNLRVVARVRAQDAVTSNGFSVAAIPENWTQTFNSLITGASRGIRVNDMWVSDSGVIADLDAVEIAEEVDVASETGVFVGLGGGTNSSYLTATSFTVDSHSTPVSRITGTGFQRLDQTSKFLDRRTGVTDIPMTNTGYNIDRDAVQGTGMVTFTTSKGGAAVTANGIASGAGQPITPISRTQTVP